MVAASNRNLLEETPSGRFREDLYRRLAVFPVQMQPLRECGDDKIMIAMKVFERYANESNRLLKGFSLDALILIQEYRWPENVRQLINCVHRAIVIPENNRVGVGDIVVERKEKQ